MHVFIYLTIQTLRAELIQHQDFEIIKLPKITACFHQAILMIFPERVLSYSGIMGEILLQTNNTTLGENREVRKSTLHVGMPHN